MVDVSNSRGLDPPRSSRRISAAVGLGLWALLWVIGLRETGDPYAIVWFATGLLTSLAGLAVVIGRISVWRGDTWQAALVAAFASLFGPLSAVLLLLPPVWRSLRDVPSQWRARHEPAPAAETEALEAAAAHSQGASLALALVATALAFWSSTFVWVWFAFASSALTDGTGVVLGLTAAWVVGMVGFVAVLVVQRLPRALAGVEYAAAAGMVAAIVCVALDGGDLNWSDGNRVSVGFLYVLWGLAAAMLLWAAVLTRKAASAV